MGEAKPSLAVMRFGTETPDTKGRRLRAGALSALLDNGQLRYICVNGVEVLRAICFLVRDENWGTFTPQISGLKVRVSDDGFAVSYSAACGDAKRSLTYDAVISASKKGVVSFAARCAPKGDFLTNRTGFIVLHPLKGVAGEKVTVEHVDGRIVRAKFPAVINPVQPFRNIRALTHEVMPGLTAACRMEGDTFEMEDHRNWMDASFKTYVRPLAEPWPYVLKGGETFEQKVTLTLDGKLPRAAPAAASRPVRVKIGAATKVKMPLIGVALPAALAKATREAQALVAALGVRHFVASIDGGSADWPAALPHYTALAKACGARVTLEIVLPGKKTPEEELSPIAAAAAKLDPVAVVISPAADLKAVLPGTEGPVAPTPEAIIAAARAAFPNALIGGGMLSFFTELNRKRPPHRLLDFVTHTTSSIVHAADDLSVMETLETPPYISASVKAFIGKAKYRVGPGGIGARDNPYGFAAAANPHNSRVCLAAMDPRQRGLFGAAFTLGYAAAFAGSGLEALTLGAAAGPLGAIRLKQAEPQPWYDESGARLYPLFHILRGLAGAQGAPIVLTECSEPAKVATLACRRNGGNSAQGLTLWLANLTGARQNVSFGKEMHNASVVTLDEHSFAAAASDPDFLDRAARRKARLAGVTLAPYAVVMIAI
jgi:D-apionolactonase